MCRTAQAVLSVVICGTQMVVRVFMTFLLMLENLLRLFMQTFYNIISFVLQLLSLLPICIVFIVSSRLKCFMCGGGGPCPVNRGGGCDCLMSLMAIIILFFIFRATGVLDKIFYSIGYAKAPTHVARFIPTPGEITECSRNDTEVTEYELDYITTANVIALDDAQPEVQINPLNVDNESNENVTIMRNTTTKYVPVNLLEPTTTPRAFFRADDEYSTWLTSGDNNTVTNFYYQDTESNLTTVLYYFV